MAPSRTVPSWVTSGQHQAIGLKHGFRSGLEKAIAERIQHAGHEVRFESFRVPYEVPAKLHHYTPDFLLDNGIIIEGKGIFDATDRAKHLFIKAQYPDLDIRFVFSRSQAPITPGSKTTLAAWCKRYGYEFADKAIPPAWFKEPGPDLKPDLVLARGPFGWTKDHSSRKGKST